MTLVFVSGCYELLHAGHVQFFSQARALGDRLVVSIAHDPTVWQHKGRLPVLPIDHRVQVISALRDVDEVVVSDPAAVGLDFERHFRRLKPDILAVTEDDQYGDAKRALCADVGATYVVLPKTRVASVLDTTAMRRRLCVPPVVPMRADFAGGWLDVPRLARAGGHIINCAVTPGIHEYDWRHGGGMGGSAAAAIARGEDALSIELGRGVGWQDPAVICETGVCVWRSGEQSSLRFKSDGRWLRGLMSVVWTGSPHDTTDLVSHPRDYQAIVAAGMRAEHAVRVESLGDLASAVRMSYRTQLGEGMRHLPELGECAKKYCGAGHGGYAVYLFGNTNDRRGDVDIEPFCAD